VKNDYAQITIDYIAGMGIFLLAVFFVFQFVYGLFTPFQSSSNEITLAADRAAATLVEQLLRAGGSGELNVVDQGKLYYFINTRLNYFDEASYNSALLELGLFSNEAVFDLNVSVAYTNGTLMNQNGPTPADNTDIGQTRRLVLLVNSSTGYNETAIISVKVW